MTEDLHQACVEAMRRIEWRLEKQHRREQERSAELSDYDAPAVTNDAFETCEWDLLLDQLSANERHIVLDIVIHGNTEQKLAERMDWSLARVHRTKMRALAALRKMLDE